MVQQFINIKLTNPKQLTPTVDTFYTVPSGCQVIVTSIFVVNTDIAANTVSVFFCPSGSTADASNVFISNKSIDGDTYHTVNPGQVLNAGDVIRVSAAQTGLTMHASGILVQTL